MVKSRRKCVYVVLCCAVSARTSGFGLCDVSLLEVCFFTVGCAPAPNKLVCDRGRTVAHNGGVCVEVIHIQCGLRAHIATSRGLYCDVSLHVATGAVGLLNIAFRGFGTT